MSERDPLATDQWVDPALASLLSRLASLRGRAFPAYRFGTMTIGRGGVELATADRPIRAVEWWQSAFPAGSVAASKAPPDAQALPLLWLGDDGERALILRGRLSNGGYAAESATGQSTLSLAEFSQGMVLALDIAGGEAATDIRSERATTAMHYFVRAVRKRKGPFVEAVVATTAANLLALGASFFSMQVYDRVVPTQGFSTLMVLTIGVVIAVLLELVLKQFRVGIVERACRAIDEELSGFFFDRMLNIRMDARPSGVGTFAGQIRQYETVRNFLTASTLFLLADAPYVFFFIAIIAMVGGVVAAVPLALFPLIILTGLVARWRISRLAEDQLTDMNRKNGLLVEAVDGIEAVKAVSGEWKMLDRWVNLSHDTAERDLRIRTIAMGTTNMTQTLQQLSYVLMIALGAYSISQGLITSGALVACSILSNRALSPMAQISGLIVQWHHAKAALKGLDNILSLPEDRDPDARLIIPEDCLGQLQVENVSFAYAGGEPALKAINLTLRPGERVALIGPVGAGKSTLLKILSGLYRPGEGKLLLDGVDVALIDPTFVREHVGYLTQDVRLFGGTLRDNLTVGLPSPSDGQILAAAQRTGLDRLIRSHPKSLELPLSEGGRGISGGQRQLVGLTRLELARPRILLLDEPTASMDGDLERYVMQNMLEDMPKDSTVVLSTHKTALLSLVTRIVVVDQAKIVADGPRDEVMAKLASIRKQSGPRLTGEPERSNG